MADWIAIGTVVTGVVAAGAAVVQAWAALQAKLEAQKQQIEVNTELIKRLAEIEQNVNNRLAAIEQVVNNRQEKEIYTTIINDYELKHLQRLASSESYLKYVKRESFKQELRRLRTLGLIETYPSKHIGSMPREGNLRDYVKITERGQDYLKVISK
jgi:hypothetical protein